MNVDTLEEREFLRYLWPMFERGGLGITLSLKRRWSTLLGLLFLCLCLPLHVLAQDDLNIHGVIADAMTSSKIDGVTVTVKKDGAKLDSYTTRANGKYEFYLDCGSRYEFIFAKEGYVERSIVIDSRNVPEEVIGAGLIMPTDMSMYEITPAMEEMDMSVFEQPIGKAQYDATEQDLVWDFGHTQAVKAEIFAFIREAEKREKELEKEAEAADKAAEEAEEKFAKFVEDGNTDMSKQNYKDAVLNYTAALEIKPENAEVKAKLEDAQAKFDEAEKARKLDDDYNTALDAGDGFMRTEEYDKAIEQYNAALALKPGESYPTEQIAEANRILEEQAANMANQEKFNQLIAEGDGLVEEEKFEEALVPYKAAKDVFPENREVQRKIEEAEAALAAIAEKAAKQGEYDNLIATADAAFQEENYEAAKESYKLASQVFTDEAYPQERMALCDEKIAELASLADRQEKYDEAMAEAETAMGATEYAEAIGAYEEALTHMPDDETATSQLAEANRLLEEQKAAMALDENYELLVKEGDDLFQDENYLESKAKFEEALALKAEEAYPKEQIEKIDALLVELEAEMAAQKAYDDAMTAGNTAMEAQDFTEAITQFEAALAVKEGDVEAMTKLEEAQGLKEKQDNDKAANEAYQALIDSGDELFANGQYDEARADYEQALEVKNEAYPRDQIALIEQTLAQLADEAAEQERLERMKAQYDAYMEAGSTALEADKFDEAIAAFVSALEVMPDDAEASAKLNEAESLKQAMMDEAAKDQLYSEQILKADDLFEQKLWDEAMIAYSDAVRIKPEEIYPQDQIAKIEEELEKERLAKAAADEAAREEMIAGLVAEGDVLLAEKQYQSALDKYEEAFALDNSKTEIQAKIEEANTLLLAFLEAEANKEAYAQAIADGDAQFEDQNYQRSKSSFEEAASIFPEETYPKEKIAEIDQILLAQAEAEEAERLRKLNAEVMELIADGDKRMSKKKYEKARGEYEAALALVPDHPLATQKLDEVNGIINEIEEAEASLRAYEAAIDEADGYFKDESYEMAKLKYLDAKELMPSESYPENKIAEIEMILERERLAALQAEKDALDASYREALREADGFLNEKNYVQAIAGYEDALELKPDEQYPQSQLERIELLIQEEEAAELERQRLEALRAENKAKRKTVGVKNSVNTNSEDQAEQFMREALAAQEREKYERIKEEKRRNKENLESYREQSRTQRMAAQMSLEYYASADDQYSEAKESQEQQAQNSQKYKEAMLESQSVQNEMGDVRMKYAQEQIQNQASDRESWMADLRAIEEAKIARARDTNREQLSQLEESSAMAAARKIETSEREYISGLEVYGGNPVAESLRNKRSEELLEQYADREEYQRELAEQKRQEILQKSKENEQSLAAYESDSFKRGEEKRQENIDEINNQKSANNDPLADSKRIADQRRAQNAQELESLQKGEPKSYDDYFRTQLAENYPQGVTEESSTQGNKVIITRIVVKGNRGDEYKKVVDKAGSYYFKNGQSISKATWNRETIEAFRGKD